MDKVYVLELDLDNGEEYEEHYEDSFVLGVFDSREKALAVAKDRNAIMNLLNKFFSVDSYKDYHFLPEIRDVSNEYTNKTAAYLYKEDIHDWCEYFIVMHVREFTLNEIKEDVRE